MSQALRRDVAIGEVPAFSISAGPGTIFGVEGLLPPPRKIVFIADRVDKADAVLQGLTGRVTAECPVSFIQEYAGNPRHQLIVLLTEEAAARFV
jgi:6-phosphogluconolactonase/glucosamine-6-phosphate isomerase/deaminase